MGFLKKMGLIEEVEENLNYTLDNEYTQESTVEVDLKDVRTDNLIHDIYEANGKQDISKSIFKVKELINSLPKEMVTDTKRISVLAILNSFGLSKEEVIEDGISRSSLLNAALSEMTNNNNSEIENAKALIENHKKEIEDLEKIVSGLNESNKNCKENIDKEVNEILELIKFMEGDK